MMIATPIEEISGASVPALRRRSGANATRSDAEDDGDERRDHKRCPQRHRTFGQRERRKRRRRKDRRMRQIQNIEHAEHQRVSHREQRVHGP